MRKLKLFYLLFGTLLIGSCANEVSETYTYKINEPVFVTADKFRTSVKVSRVPQKIEIQGKMAFYKDFMYISEPEKGIHIIDNRNPSRPAQIGFIAILGNADMAIKDNLLYADSYIDLVWFDISNPAQPMLRGRKEEVFPTSIPMPDNFELCDYEKAMNRENGIVIGWELKERKGPYPMDYYYLAEGMIGAVRMDNMSATTSGNKSVGLTGSMSRFAIYQNFLYTVLYNQLGIFNIESEKPEKMGENVPLKGSIETIFSYKENLFMGAPTGMFIYSVSNPIKPEFQSFSQHAYGCDPVVVENDIAYVTIHAGNNCGQNVNQLIVLDVSDVKKPAEIAKYEMTKPKGLGIDNGALFVCDDGLKVFDAANPKDILNNQLRHIESIAGYDLIAYNKLLMMIAEDGIYQYDYTDLKDIKLLSKISIGN